MKIQYQQNYKKIIQKNQFLIIFTEKQKATIIQIDKKQKYFIATNDI